jgi:hypothetical protein
VGAQQMTENDPPIERTIEEIKRERDLFLVEHSGHLLVKYEGEDIIYYCEDCNESYTM